MEEDSKRTESDTSRGQGKRQTKQATGSVPQRHEPEEGHVALHMGVL
jgi:hypothetical protein